MDRAGKSLRNLTFGVIYQIIVAVLSFVTRTYLIKEIGLEAVSLNSLFSEVISVLSLAELGIGSSITFSLYKPIANGDKDKICQLMKLYKKAYTIIAAITFVIGVALVPFIQYFISDISYDMSYIRLVYFLFVIQLSVSYLFSYKTSLLSVDQKYYIHSIIACVVKVVGTIIQLVLLFVIPNYIVYLSVSIAITILTNVFCSITVDRMYPYIKNKAEPLEKEEKKGIYSNMRNVFVKGVSGKITDSTDNILISTLISTLQVGYYANYNTIFGMMKSFMTQVDNALTGSVGNMLAMETVAHSQSVFRRLNYIFFCLAMILAVCTFTCITPFIKFWLGEEYLLGFDIVIVCSINLFIYITTRPLWVTMSVSGLFSLDKWSGISGSIINLIVSIVLGLTIGMVGIFIGTMMTYLIQMVLKSIWLYKFKWNISPLKYDLMMLFEFALGILMFFVCYYICGLIVIENNIFQFICNGFVTLFICLFFMVITTFWTKEFKYTCGLIADKLHLKKKKESKENKDL